jgi:hypothetical protein
MARLLNVIAKNMRFKLATMACLRMLVSLAAHPGARRWLLENTQLWLADWLLGTNGEGVRAVAETLVITLLTRDAPASPDTTPRGPTASGMAPSEDIDGMPLEVEGPLLPGATTIAATTPATTPFEPPQPPPPTHSACLDLLYNHLLSLLPWATDIAKELSLQIREAPDPRDVPGNKALLQEHSSMRLAAYFRVLTWMVKNGAVASVPLAPLLSCYDAQDVQHIEHDESKRHLITFWYYAALAPQPSGPVHASALMLAAQPNTFRRLLDSHVSLRPKERSIQYNQQLLTPFYGLMRAVLEYETVEPPSYDCHQVLHTHRNWEWAVRYILIETSDYASLLPLHAARLPNRLGEGRKPLPEGLIDLQRAIKPFIDSESAHSVLHLLCDDRDTQAPEESRFIRGALWVAPLTFGTPQP